MDRFGGSQVNFTDPPPPYSERPDTNTIEAGIPQHGRSTTEGPVHKSTTSSFHHSDSSPSRTEGGFYLGPEPPQATSSSYLERLRDALAEKKRAREARRKVDFYQRIYGFVPKNVMTEAEWRRAKERAPKEKVPFSFRPRPFFGIGPKFVFGII
ncbi:hypothetical protein ACO1O0_002878 [Amphichorda felina]